MNATHAKRIASNERAEKAVIARIEGCNYREIGEQLGVSRQAAHKMVRKEMAKRRLELDETIDEFIFLENERLDMLARPLWDKIEKGDIPSINTMLKIMVRRSKLLGLDAETYHSRNNQTSSYGDVLADKLREKQGHRMAQVRRALEDNEIMERVKKVQAEMKKEIINS